MVERLFDLVTLVNLVKYSYNCKHSGVYMVGSMDWLPDNSPIEHILDILGRRKIANNDDTAIQAMIRALHVE